MTLLEPYLSGAIMMGCIVASLFFARFYRKSHDQLFALFSSAFALLALERVVLVFVSTHELRPAVYVIRLIAFGLIIVGIILKNRGR